MKVFVTGGTGFIGGAVVRQLRDRGDEVVFLVRNPEKADDGGGARLRDRPPATSATNGRSATGWAAATR